MFRRNLMNNYYGIPEAYQELTYLQGTGRYTKILTGVNSYNIRLEFETDLTGSGNVFLFGGAWGQGMCFSLGMTNCYYNSKNQLAHGLTGRHKLVVDNNILYENGAKIVEFEKATGTPSNSLALFRTNSWISQYWVGTVTFYGHFMIYVDSIKVREYVPVKRIEDSICGYYDLINKTFNVSSEGGDFIGGEPI